MAHEAEVLVFRLELHVFAPVNVICGKDLTLI